MLRAVLAVFELKLKRNTWTRFACYQAFEGKKLLTFCVTDAETAQTMQAGVCVCVCVCV